MNYYGSKELAASFRTVRNNTVILAEEIPAEHYDFRVSPDTRSVAQTLAHITLTPRLQEQIHGVERRITLEGFDFFSFLGALWQEEQKPRTKDEILESLRTQGYNFALWLESLSDDFLGERVTYPAGMMPPVKTRFEMILGVKEHEMHHRGQLMIIQRMIGIIPHLTRGMQAKIAEIQAQRAAEAASA